MRSEPDGQLNGCNVTLPDFENTEQAIAYGRFITRDQFIFLSGAEAALKREFDSLRLYGGQFAQQQCADLATKMQLIHECLDVAPDLVLASLIGGDRCQRDSESSFDDEPRPFALEPIDVGHL